MVLMQRAAAAASKGRPGRGAMNLVRLVAVSSLFTVSISIVDAQELSPNWPDYLGGSNSAHYSPLKQITPANVGKLEVAWSYPAGDGLYTFSPLVVDNVAYVAAKQGS